MELNFKPEKVLAVRGPLTRNYLLKKNGQRFSDLMVDILHGDKPFPTNVSEKLKAKIKEMVF